MRTLITADEIQQRVRQLGAEATHRYRGRPLTVVGVLNGAALLTADLVRAIETPHQMGFVKASSYRGEVTRGGELQLDLHYVPNVVGRQVLLVDDIYDSGRTLSALVDRLWNLGAAEVRTLVLLWKERPRQVERVPDAYGFRIPDEFVVGYGLDFNDNYRHLPHIAILEMSDQPRSEFAETA